MKVFLSYPMYGYSEEEQQRFKNELMEMLNDIPDISFVDNSDCKAPEGAGRLYCLGEAIKKMDGCDAIAMHYLFHKANGCCIEVETAKKYGLRIFAELSPGYIMRSLLHEAWGFSYSIPYSEQRKINFQIESLEHGGVESVEQLVNLTKEDIMKMRGFGRVSSVHVLDAINYIKTHYSDIIGKILYSEIIKGDVYAYSETWREQRRS